MRVVAMGWLSRGQDQAGFCREEKEDAELGEEALPLYKIDRWIPFCILF